MALGLKTRVKTIVLFRVLFLLVMACSGTMLHYFYHEAYSEILIQLLTAGFGFSLLSGFLLLSSARGFVRIVAELQIIFDVCFTTILVHVTGGLHSVFILLYGVHILTSAVALMSYGALASAGFSAMVFAFSCLYGQSDELWQDPQFVSRLLANSSFLLLFGGFVAWLFKNRGELAKNLEKTTADLRELNHLHSAIVDHISSGILYAEKNSRIRLMNRMGAKILGDSWVGKKIRGSSIDCFLQYGERLESKVSLNNRNAFIGHHYADLPDDQGFVVVFQDVTNIRELEGRIQLKEKLAAVGQLAAGIAHEIRNPLASISGSIQLIQAEVAAHSGIDKLMQIVIRETDRLDQLAQDFLDYAKPSHLRLEPVPLGESFQEIASLVENSPKFRELNLKLHLKVRSDLVCGCDRKQLQQILWNLLKNAVEASLKNGEIVLSAEEIHHQEQGFVLFSVSDKGTGIPSELRSKIFEPFFSTKTAGTGLGLALVYEMVRAHAGTIGVDSDIKVGTRFWFEFPKNGPQTSKSDTELDRAAA